MGDNGELEELVESPDELLLEGDGWSPLEDMMRRRTERQRSHLAALHQFLGEDRTATASVVQPPYYRRLLAWALQRYIEEHGWQTVRTVGYQRPEPFYTDVNAGGGETANVLCDGTLFLVKEDELLAVTVDAGPRGDSSVVVTGPARLEDATRGFAAGLETTVRERNFYRGKNIEFGGDIAFLHVAPRSWDSIVLDEEAMEEIEANTTGFMARRESLARYGIPARRGVLLTGAPGTGKTLVCKALMSASGESTCIAANTYALAQDEYITLLYELARDLAPTIVFIEDIDLIAKDRVEWGGITTPALLALLAEMDGIEECREVVTVATTNHPETLDKALRQRPSRFDRIIEIPCPSLEQRRRLVSALCETIPLEERVRDRIVRRTEGFTAAQIQEVLYSLAIRHGRDGTDNPPHTLTVTTDQADRAISMIGGKGRAAIGFRPGNARLEQGICETTADDEERAKEEEP